MSEERTQKEALVYFLQDHILEAIAKIGILQKDLDASAETMKTGVSLAGGVLLNQLNTINGDLIKNANAFSDVATKSNKDLIQLTETLKGQLIASAEASKDAAKFVLQMGASDLARDAVQKSTNEVIIPVLKNHIAGTLKAVELSESSVRALGDAVERAKPHFTKAGWPMYLSLSSVIFISIFLSFATFRTWDSNWPRKFSAQETYYFNKGIFLEKLWSTLDERTQKIYLDRVEQIPKKVD